MISRTIMWVNPTGGRIRVDSLGDGHFGASRTNSKGVHHDHDGCDYEGMAEQIVHAVRSGEIYKIGYPYKGDTYYRYVGVRTADGWLVDHFYVSPSVLLNVGTWIDAGEQLGLLQDLRPRDGEEITNHCHVRLTDPSGRRVNPAFFIPEAA